MGMKLLSVVIPIAFLLMSCSRDPSPGSFAVPEFVSVDSEVGESNDEGCTVTLRARLSSSYGVDGAGFHVSGPGIDTRDIACTIDGSGFFVLLECLPHAMDCRFEAYATHRGFTLHSDPGHFRTSDAPLHDIGIPGGAFRDAVSALCDADSDGLITASEAAALSRLEICTDDIASLSGVELLLSLASLSCAGTLWKGHLTALDVSPLPTLGALDCKYNHLSTLSLPASGSLESLDCSYNNLETLDLSSQTGLVSLDCYCNDIPSLDLSMLTALEKCVCGYNGLTELDVSSCRSLTSLDVRDSPHLATVYMARGQKIPELKYDSHTRFKYKD